MKRWKYWIERYGLGYIVCRSTGNDCEYAGEGRAWSAQPAPVGGPFGSELNARTFILTVDPNWKPDGAAVPS